jgi:hypothetical protein
MKIERLETHDRFEYFVQGGFNIAETCAKIIDGRPFGDHPFYLFVHKRTIDETERFKYWLDMGGALPLDKVPNARIIWQPRLTKPYPQENSILIKCYPGKDVVKFMWIIPQKELWEQFSKGKMTENETIYTSIDKFQHCPDRLAAPEPDDFDDAKIQDIYADIRRQSIKLVKPKPQEKEKECA